VRTTRFWNNLHQVRSKSKDWKENNLKIWTLLFANNISSLLTCGERGCFLYKWMINIMWSVNISTFLATTYTKRSHVYALSRFIIILMFPVTIMSLLGISTPLCTTKWYVFFICSISYSQNKSLRCVKLTS